MLYNKFYQQTYRIFFIYQLDNLISNRTNKIKGLGFFFESFSDFFEQHFNVFSSSAYKILSFIICVQCVINAVQKFCLVIVLVIGSWLFYTASSSSSYVLDSSSSFKFLWNCLPYRS